MTLTPKEQVKFDVFMAKLRARSKKPDDKQFGMFMDYIDYLEKRVTNLEILMFWSILNDMGEQGITPELREACRQLGLMDKLNEFLRMKP